MKRVILSLFAVLILPCAFAAEDRFIDCGPGYVQASAPSREGRPTVECKKLWCRDLETGKVMGNASTAAAGYEMTPAASELCDNSSPQNCVECFGRRKWCSGEPAGAFNPEYGAYIRPNAGQAIYRGVLSGSCFKWRLQENTCGPNEIAINNGNTWVCLTEVGSSAGRSAIQQKAVMRTSMPVKR